MAIDVDGLCGAMLECEPLRAAGLTRQKLRRLLSGWSDQLEVQFVEPAKRPFVRSGSPFTGPMLIREGRVVPATFPHSVLIGPFLIGLHEFLAVEYAIGTPRWVSSYTAVNATTIVRLPVGLMTALVRSHPRLRSEIEMLVLRRLARFYWTSLSTVGTNRSKVAAALVSRLALDGFDHGRGRVVSVLQKDLVRLTATSRTGVWAGLKDLRNEGVIEVDTKPGTRIELAGTIRIPNVSRLKEAAEDAFTERVVDRLIR